MKIEQQVCSLELSKKLKELGVKQDSLFYWLTINKSEIITKRELELARWNNKYVFPAFTVAELGEMLPNELALTHKGQKNDWWIKPQIKIPHFHADTEANARAKMLIYLIENKLI